MKRRKILTGLLSPSVFVAFALFGFSCSFGDLPPAGTDSALAGLSLSIGSLTSTAASSRAIVQGSSNLYIRTIGGATGDAGPLYGPYSVSAGSEFKTFDLPAGSYDRLIFLYSGKDLESAGAIYPISGVNYSLRQILSMDDASMIEFYDAEGETSIYYAAKQALGDDFDGMVSTGVVRGVTLRRGAVTSVSATLIPILGSGDSFDVSTGGMLPAATSAVRRFFAVSGLTAPSGSTLSCSLSGTAQIGSVAMFDGAGRKLMALSNVGAVQATSWSSTMTGSSEMYLYIEYSATSALTLSFSVAASGYTFDFVGSPTYAGKYLYFGVYDMTGVSVSTTEFDHAGTMVGVGIIALDSSGSGSSLAYSYPSGSVATIAAGHTYELSTFIDMNGNYTAYTTISSITASALQYMMPHYGDYTYDSEALTASGNSLSLSLSSSSLSMCDNDVYFVSSTGSVSASGATPETPITLDAAVAAGGSGTSAQIFVLDNVSLSTALSINLDTVVFCMNSTASVISLSDLYSGFTVAANTSLTLYNIVLDGSSYSGLGASPITVLANGTAALVGGSSIRNVTLMGEISGGAVTVGEGGVFSMDSSSITNCSAPYGYGGGVYVSGGTVTLTTSSSITGCSAAQGGGVYLYGYTGPIEYFGTLFTDLTSTISDNSADYTGGGVWFDGTYGDTSGVMGPVINNTPDNMTSL